MKVSQSMIDLIVDYYAKEETEETQLPGVVIPNRQSPYYEQLIYAVRKVDGDFGSGIFRKVEPKWSDAEIVQKSSPLPSIAISGKVRII